MKLIQVCHSSLYRAGHVPCRPLVSHSGHADGTDRQRDVRPLHYTFRYTG